MYEFEARAAVGQRVADQVVVVQQAGVVVPELQAERGRDASEQVGLPRPVRPDQEQRFAADQRAQDDGSIGSMPMIPIWARRDSGFGLRCVLLPCLFPL